VHESDQYTLNQQWLILDEANTVNVKLFPVFRAPSPVKAYHVPICTVQLESLMDMNWDMTLQKVLFEHSGSSILMYRLSPS